MRPSSCQPLLCRGVVLAVLWLASGLASVPRALAREAADEAFLEGLRQRQLFELAESHCQRRWAESSLTPLERGELAVEWIRTLTEHARNAAADQRATLAERAQRVADEYLAAHADHSLAYLVRVQRALAEAMLGELARLEAEVAADPEPGLDTARRLSRAAARTLEQLDRELADALPQRFRRPPSADELTADQLATLQHQVRLQAARAQRNLALAYAAGSDDRLATLGRGVQLLELSLRQLTPEMPLYAAFRLELAAQQRLLDKPAAARDALASLDPAQLPPATQLAVRAESVRGALAQRAWPEVRQQLANPPRVRGPVQAEWDFLRLEVLLEEWRVAAAEGKATSELQEQATALLEEIARDHGPYWRHRGDLALIRLGTASGTRNVDLVARTADSLVVQGRHDDALAAYDEATRLSREAGRAGPAFQCAYKAGLLQQERGRHADAAQRLHDAALAAPDQPPAAAAHLAAVWNVAQQLRQPPAPPATALAERYVAWLEEHGARWPDSPTAQEARLWLGTWHELRLDDERAGAAFRGISAEAPQALAGWRGATRCARRLLSVRNAAAGESGGDALERRAGETLAWLDSHPVPAEATDEDRQLANQLRLYALVLAPGHEAAAGTCLEEQTSLPTPVLLELLQLAQWTARRPATDESSRGSALAPFVQACVTRLESVRAGLSPAERRQVDRARAQGWALSGKREAAVELYGELARTAPQDGELQQAYAELLAAGTTRPDWQRALDQWRRIAAKSPPRSPRWWQAKLQIATLQTRLGQPAETVKLIRFLQEVPPGIAEEWRASFDAARAAAERAPPP